MKRTPLYSTHLALSARMIDFAGWEMPVQYTSILKEHRAVRNAAGLFDISHMGDIIIQGEGAEEGLRGILTNDIKGLSVGRGLYAHILDEQGRTQDDVITFQILPGTYLQIPNASTTPKICQWIEEHVDARVINVSERLACMALQGPRSAAILQRLTDADVAGLRRMHGAFMVLNVEAPEGGAFLADIIDVSPPSEGVLAYVTRSGYTGEDGFEILVDAAVAVPIWDALMAAGKVDCITPCGLGARDLLRLEMGFLLSGTDFDGAQTPLETGPGWIIKWDHAFVGREALLRQKEGSFPRLVGIELMGRRIPRQGHPIRADGKIIGKVTSGTLSPILNRGIALGYVTADYAIEGKEVEIGLRNSWVGAKIVTPPFIKKG
ncbi:MAG: glycine cleavage system aminomethyltransferase GcvT [Euryarchaeota archaeon]|nr:glycine cleavage system aminomethyltransferase GcvT [Euryarchaeota archaeon]